jgi:hypothetical protein
MTETDRKQIEAAKAALDKATPGPWEQDEGTSKHLIISEVGDRIVCYVHQCTRDAEWQPNATLLAAAPALVRRVIELEGLLKMCGAKIGQAMGEVKAIETYDAGCTLREALAALKEAGWHELLP